MTPAPLPPPNDDAADTPAGIAAHWIEALTRGDATPADIADLRAWIAADPAHADAYAKARAAWAALPDTHLKRRRPALRLVAGGALAAGLALATALWPGVHDHATAIGQVASLVLPDGTRAWLDSGSAIDLAYDAGHRTVRLARGRAAFQVAHDPDRPFAVEALDATVRDVGTTFSVDRYQGLEIAVEQGQVEVSRGGRSIRLAAGDQARFTGDRFPSPHGLAPDALAWRNRRIVLDHTPLKEALHELGRYYPGRIVLTAPALGQRRVSGALFTDRPAEGLETIARSEHLQIRRLPWLILVSRND